MGQKRRRNLHSANPPLASFMIRGRGVMNLPVKCILAVLSVAGIAASALVSGCAGLGHPSAISFYDNCAKQGGSFVEMASCGKLNRNSYCESKNLCSADGNAFVLYTDGLAKAVANHEMSEAQAQIKWVEFRNAQLNALRQRKATLASGGPSTCVTTGNVTNCY